MGILHYNGYFRIGMNPFHHLIKCIKGTDEMANNVNPVQRSSFKSSRSGFTLIALSYLSEFLG